MHAAHETTIRDNLRKLLAEQGVPVHIVRGRSLLGEWPHLRPTLEEVARARREGEPFALSFRGAERAELALDLFAVGALQLGLNLRYVEWREFLRWVEAGAYVAPFSEIGCALFRGMPREPFTDDAEAALRDLYRKRLSMAFHLPPGVASGPFLRSRATELAIPETQQ